MTPLQERFLEAIDNAIDLPSGRGQKVAAITCSEITLEKMGKALEWADTEGFVFHETHKVWTALGQSKIRLTTSELIQKFLNETK